jgi:E3 ubiquitin-protein ligase TRIP12
MAEREEKIAGLRLEGRKVDDLYLDFTLPGLGEWELKPHGADIDLTIDNVEEYVTLTVKALLEDGVRLQLDAFRHGFEEVFNKTILAPPVPGQFCRLL